jgi:very-short-patch-repair endonuclease
MSAAQRKRFQQNPMTEEFLEKRARAIREGKRKGKSRKGTKLRPEQRENVRQAVIRRLNDPRERKKISDARKKYLEEHPEAVKRLVSAGTRSRKKGEMTSIETMVAEVLTDQGYAYAYEKPVGRYAPDFTVCENIIIEVDGVRWHSTSEQILRDQKRDMELTAAGYQVIRLKEEWIRADVGACVVFALSMTKAYKSVSFRGVI